MNTDNLTKLMDILREVISLVGKTRLNINTTPEVHLFSVFYKLMVSSGLAVAPQTQ